MKLFSAAALAATIAFACPAFAAECDISKQIDHAKEVAKSAIVSGRFSGMQDLKGADLMAFIKAANAQFSSGIPEDGHIEEGLVIVVDGTVHLFGFVGGCQEGHVALPAMPSKLSAPTLLPHGLRMI